MKSYEDIWYAAKSTRIVYMPPKLLETFGESRVSYTVVAEDPDGVNRLNIRCGIVTAERPRIITPGYFVNQAVENFGTDARRYFDEVMSRAENARFLQYGLQFRKQEFNVQQVYGEVQEVAEQAARDAQDSPDQLCGVLTADDDTWEISLLYFITRMVDRSVPHHARDMAGRGLFDLQGSIPRGVAMELEEEMNHCTTLDEARNLGAKLRDYGVFEEYEDRFYQLYRRLK
ncbi:MAG: hypothetical protein J6S21_04530 [Victivallales bacterium]|nr:hypothetical protein [Victivallales bacterium]